MSDAPLPLLYALAALAVVMVAWLIGGEVRSWRRGARRRGIVGLAQQLDAIVAEGKALADDARRLDGMRAAGLLPPPDPSREPGWGGASPPELDRGRGPADRARGGSHVREYRGVGRLDGAVADPRPHRRRDRGGALRRDAGRGRAPRRRLDDTMTPRRADPGTERRQDR